MVMGNNGAIVLEGSNFIISETGAIIQNDVTVDTLRIRKFEPESLRKYGMNLLTATDESTDGNLKTLCRTDFLNAQMSIR